MPEAPSAAHIVYCESGILLDRGPYESWWDIQAAYDDYTTSLGPWSEGAIVDFLHDDWGPDDSQWPFTRRAIADFFRSTERRLHDARSLAALANRAPRPSSDEVPIPEWHRALIAERLAEHRAHPDDATPWERVREWLKRLVPRDRG